MSEDRGMMKWAPYQSLVDQATSLALMRRRKNKIPKPSVSSDQAAEINEILVNYRGEILSATYWKDGFLFEVRGRIKKIDTLFAYLLLEDTKIELRNLIRLRID